jgi:hypothetical protein
LDAAQRPAGSGRRNPAVILLRSPDGAELDARRFAAVANAITAILAEARVTLATLKAREV